MGPATLAILLLAAAQQVPSSPAPPSRNGRLYMQGVSVATRDVGQSNYHRIDPPLAGYALGLTMAVGYSFTPSASVEAEVALAGVVSTPQVFSYNWREEFVTENVDRFVTVLGRWTATDAHVSFVAGGGLTFTTVNQREGLRGEPFAPGRPMTPIADNSETYTALTLTAGMDADIPLTSRIALVPSGRLRWVNRPSDGMGFLAGSGPYVFQFGIGGRAYTVTPYIAGGTLPQCYDRHRRGLADRLAALLTIAEALLRAHAQATAHGHLVPANVLCEPRTPFVAHIVDFDWNAGKVAQKRLGALIQDDVERLVDLAGLVLQGPFAQADEVNAARQRLTLARSADDVRSVLEQLQARSGA